MRMGGVRVISLWRCVCVIYSGLFCLNPRGISVYLNAGVCCNKPVSGLITTEVEVASLPGEKGDVDAPNA